MDARSITYITLEVLIAATALVGNSLVLWAVAINKRLRTVTNLFIVSLAVADILVGVVAIPCAIASYNGLPHYNFYGCVFVNSIVILFTQSSVFSLLAIAIERYTAIKYPYAYERYFSTRNAVKIIAATWILSILIGLVPIMGWNLHPPLGKKCAFTEVIDMQYMVYFNFFVCILLPLTVMLGFYGYIFHIVRKQMRQIASLQLRGQSGKNQKNFMKEIKAAKSLSMVIGFFALCWLPIHIMNSITLLCGEKCNQPYDLLLAAILLSHANSAVNPLLYAFCNSLFKTTFKKICLCNGFSSRNTHTPSDEVFTVSRPYSNGISHDIAQDGIKTDMKRFPEDKKNNVVVTNFIKKSEENLEVRNHNTAETSRPHSQGISNPVFHNTESILLEEASHKYGISSESNNGVPVTRVG